MPAGDARRSAVGWLQLAVSRTLSQRIGMHHDTSLIDIIAVGLAVAFVLGTLAQKVT
ncbi:hypothetical protein [Xanthomonas campestris]|uniref:hypothetical protein n=1 Tax=Xanthomonas campestris TaxID=339 RepID=UPI0032E45911